MHGELKLDEMKKEWHGSLQSYLIGFVVSLLLTSLSFLLVVYQVLSGVALISTVICLAVLQAIFQLIYFLHLGKEAKPSWETPSFYFMVIILLIVVLGTLWIMYDLTERVMSMMSAMHGAS